MRWVRANSKVGTWSALFALAIQLIVLFGHFHSSGIGLESTSPSLAVSSTRHAIPVVTDEGGPPSKPAVPTVHYCAICAVINLTGSSVPPATPTILLPSVVSRMLAFPRTEISLTAPPHLYAQARAPPQA